MLTSEMLVDIMVNMLVKNISASDAKTRFGAVMNWTNKMDVVVESYGEPKMVLLSYTKYKKIVELREKYKREMLLDQMRSLKKRIKKRNVGLKRKDIKKLADRFSSEIVVDLIKEGKVKYEGAS